MTREMCLAMDQNDSLAALREHFALPGDVIYLDGNSLGARPLSSAERAMQLVQQEWGRA